MEVWWWIEPMFQTGLVCSLIGGVIGYTFWGSDSHLANILTCLLLLPLAIAAISAIGWLLCDTFYLIWSPYI